MNISCKGVYSVHMKDFIFNSEKQNRIYINMGLFSIRKLIKRLENSEDSVNYI